MTQNFGNIMKQAKKIQEKIAQMQVELETKTVEASAGGGMVAVVVNGKFEILSLKVDKEVVSKIFGYRGFIGNYMNALANLLDVRNDFKDFTW